MLTADVAGIVSLASTSSERGHCLDCAEEVVAKVGPVMLPHWAHLPSSTSACPRKTRMTHWHEEWQLLAYKFGCDIEKRMLDGKHRADIVTPKGLVVELQSDPLAPAEAAVRELFYNANTDLGMVWVVRLPENVTLDPERGYFKGPIHPRLTDLNARTYLHDTLTDEVHAATFTTNVNEDENRIYTSARHQHTWGNPEAFLRWAKSWTADHLEGAAAGWRRGVWHDESKRK